MSTSMSSEATRDLAADLQELEATAREIERLETLLQQNPDVPSIALNLGSLRKRQSRLQDEFGERCGEWLHRRPGTFTWRALAFTAAVTSILTGALVSKLLNR